MNGNVNSVGRPLREEGSGKKTTNDLKWVYGLNIVWTLEHYSPWFF